MLCSTTVLVHALLQSSFKCDACSKKLFFRPAAQTTAPSGGFVDKMKASVSNEYSKLSQWCILEHATENLLDWSKSARRKFVWKPRLQKPTELTSGSWFDHSYRKGSGRTVNIWKILAACSICRNDPLARGSEPFGVGSVVLYFAHVCIEVNPLVSRSDSGTIAQ